MKQKVKLNSVTLCGFKSFDSNPHTITFGQVTILIGANGAGKSNVVSFFNMVGSMMTSTLQLYVGKEGGASSVLHKGPQKTPSMSAKFVFKEEDNRKDEYKFSLSYAAQDNLIFNQEIISVENEINIDLSAAGLKESALKQEVSGLEPIRETVQSICRMLQNCSVFQFHDTSYNSELRTSCSINQYESLYGNGGNLAAFLYGLKNNEASKPYYDKIVRHIRQVYPPFGNFILQPSLLNPHKISLEWCEQENPNYKLGAHQLSDGTLRFMALAALLLQPVQNLPSVIVIDEPELGLHPSAITELAAMVNMASQHSQIILATQSPALLDEFSAEQITVIERDPISHSSIFKQFKEEELQDWLKDYTLSEIWDKNILGGKP